MSSRRAGLISTALCCSAVFAAVMGLLAVRAQPAEGEGGLVKGGDAPGIIMLYTGDVIGYLDPCG